MSRSRFPLLATTSTSGRSIHRPTISLRVIEFDCSYDVGRGSYRSPDLGSTFDPKMGDLPVDGMRDLTFVFRIGAADGRRAIGLVHGFYVQTAVAPPRYY